MSEGAPVGMDKKEQPVRSDALPHHKEITTPVSLNCFDIQNKEITTIMLTHTWGGFVYDCQGTLHRSTMWSALSAVKFY